MFKGPFLVAVTLLIAFGVGIFSTLLAVDATTGFGSIKIGPWSASPIAQTIEADPYSKSHRAYAGRLLYGSAEGLTFTAVTDSQGNALTSLCNYRILGEAPTSRFWTIYVGDEQHQLLDSEDELPTALNSRSVVYSQVPGLDIVVSATAKTHNWLAVPSNNNFTLVLTLLDTPVAGSSGLIDISMPKIDRMGCDNA